MELDERLLEEIISRVMREINYRSEKLSKNNQKLNYKSVFEEIGIAKPSVDVKEVVVGIGPAFGITLHKTLSGLSHVDVLKEVLAGIEEEGMTPRVVRVTRSSDVAYMANQVAKLSGSGIGIGIQSKGTAVIHQKDLYPLTNLELFPQAPSITLDIYRQIGKNAARYAKGEVVTPIVIPNDLTVRPKYQVKAALMQIKETELVDRDGQFIEISTTFQKGSA
ncbi:MAG: glycerol dehydratase medium subunit [Clostridiales bacterium]|nr:glycerol dehydratase medium subunit [Clostridiales bacterium]